MKFNHLRYGSNGPNLAADGKYRSVRYFLENRPYCASRHKAKSGHEQPIDLRER